MSYLQSLATHAGVGDPTQLAGVTEAKGGEVTSVSGNTTIGNLAPGSATEQLVATVLYQMGEGGNVTSVAGSVEESGWQIVQQWLQPEFDVIRYAIGIRNITASQFLYEPVSEVVSVPWSSPKDIQKVTLVADQFIPPQFPPGLDYIKYYIKPEIEEVGWIRINPIGTPTIYDENGSIVPRIVSFNTERPVSAQLEESFVNTGQEVKTVRFRALISRPTNVAGADSFSPVLKSYRLLLHPRGGL